MGLQSDEFVIQAREHLSVLESILLSLEKPGDEADARERIDRCLRIVHSIKGDAGFLGYASIRRLADAIETVLEAMRDEDGASPAPVIERLLAARDRLASLVDDLENSSRADIEELLTQLERVEGSIQAASALWDVDLREVDRLRSGRLAGFFSSFEKLGQVKSPEIEVPSGDLSRRIPEGPVHFRAKLVSSKTRDEIRESLGLPAIAAKTDSKEAIPLSIELGEWVRTSKRTLGTLLAGVDRLGKLEEAQLDIGRADLAQGLTASPVYLKGSLRTTLSVEEVRQRLTLPAMRTGGRTAAAGGLHSAR